MTSFQEEGLNRNGEHETSREFTLEILNFLCLEFHSMGKLADAGPLIDRLMGIAYGDLPPGIAAFIEASKREARSDEPQPGNATA